MTIDCNKPNLPIVEGNTIKLNIGEGEQISYTTLKYNESEFELPKLIAQGITKYSTDADPNISETELNSFKQEFYEGFIGTSDSKFSYCAGGYGSDNIVRKDAILSKFDRLYDVYANDKKITPEEYTKMLKIILDSTEYCEKENISQKQEQLTINTNVENKATTKVENKATTKVENQPQEKYWFGGLIDLLMAIFG